VRPFDAQRSGTLLGEGAAALVLEEDTAAQNRRATHLGEIVGSGCATEAQGVLSMRSDGDGLARAIGLALEDAGMDAGGVGMIVAHGTGTRQSDASEAAAILRVFGDSPPPITAFKWAFGDLMAASGAIETLLAVLALRQGVVPGVPTLRRLDTECARLLVSAEHQAPRSDVALVLCRGFAGMNAALLVRASDPDHR
jgi:3-oxoacyl-(acyl-carrier-protein) synthase